MDIEIFSPPSLEVTPPPNSVGVPLAVTPLPLIVVPGPPVFSIAAAALIPPPADIAPPVHPFAVVSPAPALELQIFGFSMQALADFPELVNLTDDVILPGMPVCSAGANGCRPAKGDQWALTEAIGLAVTAIAPNASGQIQTEGVITLTIEQWQAVTSNLAGLTPGTDYYLSSANAGRLTPTAPDASGEFLVRLGRSMNNTSMLLNPSLPIGL